MYPDVTVLMATKKYSIFIDEAVQSILSQTYESFEFLIVSTNNDPKLIDYLNRIAVKDDRIRLLFTQLSGFAFALNLGIANSKGLYIARMDDDDVSLPNRLESQIDFMKQYPEVSILGSRIDLINEYSHPLARKVDFFETDKEIRKVLPYRMPLIHPALMFRTELIRSHGGYKYGLSSEDHHLFISLSRDPSIKFHNLDKVLFKYRRHAFQGTSPQDAKKHFAEITGFLVTEFIYTLNIKYILGIFIVFPPFRSLRLFFRKIFYPKDTYLH